MSEEVFLEGKTYVSSKRAADQTGYAQDYIGQLARKGLIDAQRVGGLWYVSVASLADYQRSAASYTPHIPAAQQHRDLDSVVTFDGKDYVSASRGAKLTGYNQDYIGQLARGGKILSRQIGNRWYVDRDMLLSHKSQKDALLASVQAESVGIVRPAHAPGASIRASEAFKDDGPVLTYIQENDRDLMPVMKSSPYHLNSETADENPVSASTPVGIRRIAPPAISAADLSDVRIVERRSKKPVRSSRKTMLRATEFGVALTFVIVLSYGWTSLKAGSTYTVNISPALHSVTSGAFSATAASAADRLIDLVEKWVAPQLDYIRR